MASEEEYSDEEYSDNEFNEDSLSFEPQRMDSDTFKQRNDPAELLERFKLQLLNAYRIKQVIIENGKKKEVYKVKRKKNTEPKANNQGVEDIISYIEKFINNHTVQGHITSMEEFRNMMRYISNDLTVHFMVMRETWKINLNDIDSITSSAVNLIELFLTRTLFNEERKSYGESYKETINREFKAKDKVNFMQKLGSFMGWNKGQ